MKFSARLFLIFKSHTGVFNLIKDADVFLLKNIHIKNLDSQEGWGNLPTKMNYFYKHRHFYKH